MTGTTTDHHIRHSTSRKFIRTGHVRRTGLAGRAAVHRTGFSALVPRGRCGVDVAAPAVDVRTFVTHVADVAARYLLSAPFQAGLAACPIQGCSGESIRRMRLIQRFYFPDDVTPATLLPQVPTPDRPALECHEGVTRLPLGDKR